MRCSRLPRARDRRGRCVRSVPAMRNTPSRYSMSPAAASSSAAASSCAFLDRALGGDVHRRAADEQRARAGAAEAGAAIGVALHDADLLDRHAEHVDRELRERGREPLPHRLRRREDLDLAVAARPCTVTRSSNTSAPVHSRNVAMPRPRSRPRVFASAARAGEAVPVGERQRLVHHATRTCRCRRSCPSRSCTASARAGSCCGGAARRGSMPVWRAAASIRRSMM